MVVPDRFILTTESVIIYIPISEPYQPTAATVNIISYLNWNRDSKLKWALSWGLSCPLCKGSLGESNSFLLITFYFIFSVVKYPLVNQTFGGFHISCIKYYYIGLLLLRFFLKHTPRKTYTTLITSSWYLNPS